MFLRRFKFKWFGIFSFILVLSISTAIQQALMVSGQKETRRDIISDDFLKNRPAKSKSGKPPKKLATYRPTTTPTKQIDQSRLQVGVTIWKLEPVTPGSGNAGSSGVYRERLDWVPRRVEADAEFREGDSIRLSIESPRGGYLYVVNRDWLADGTYGETNLIFPTKGENNQLEAAKLVDIPGQNRAPFKASPKLNQSGELLTFIVTSSPLPVTLAARPIPISTSQLMAWEQRWRAEADRFEMNGGAGQARTTAEQLAAAPTGSRQLTRADPLPQTVYSLIPKNSDGLLFDLVLSYVR